MRRSALAGLLGLAALAGPAGAMMIAPPPLAQRVATADLVIVGKVTGFADKAVAAPRFPAGDKVEYQIALVQVEKVLLGDRAKKTIRVGFVPPAPAAPPPGGRPGFRPPLRRYPQVTLTVNQEACLFLTKHPSADFYVAPAYYDAINKAGNPAFAKEVEEARHCARLLADPKVGLASAKKDDRVLTAALLVTRYRTPRPSGARGPLKTEPIDAAQSQAILHALADADWAIRNPRQAQTGPQATFNRLGLTAADGWAPPRDARQYADEAKKWLREHADTYRIRRYVSE